MLPTSKPGPRQPTPPCIPGHQTAYYLIQYCAILSWPTSSTIPLYYCNIALLYFVCIPGHTHVLTEVYCEMLTVQPESRVGFATQVTRAAHSPSGCLDGIVGYGIRDQGSPSGRHTRPKTFPIFHFVSGQIHFRPPKIPEHLPRPNVMLPSCLRLSGETHKET